MAEFQVQPSNRSNPLAMTGMILGIISLVMILTSCCVFPLITSILGTLLGLTAFIMGLIAKKQINEQGAAPSQTKIANAAFIMGLIGTILGFISIVIAIITTLVMTGPLIEQQFNEILDQLDY
jgi:hypothetical protein